MKSKIRTSWAAGFLLTAMLACNMPNVNVGGTEITATSPAPAATASTSEASITSAPTNAPTEAPIALTDTPAVVPQITLTKNSNCRLGPSANYVIVDQIAQDTILPVSAKDYDGEWFQVTNATGRLCWIFNDNAQPNTDFNAVQIGEGPPLPGIPANFIVADQLCQPGPQKFTVTLSWGSGGGEKGFHLYRSGSRIAELKPTRFNYKDIAAPFNKDITYELEAFNDNGVSDRATQIVPKCK